MRPIYPPNGVISTLVGRLSINQTTVSMGRAGKQDGWEVQLPLNRLWLGGSVGKNGCIMSQNYYLGFESAFHHFKNILPIHLIQL